jgi:hypothetical protein
VKKSFTGQTELWGFFVWRGSTTPDSQIATITDAGGTNACTIYVSGNTLVMINSNFDGVGANPSATLPTNTPIYIWFRYKAGASDGVMELAWSTTTTKPTSGTGYAITSLSTMNVTMSVFGFSSNGDNVVTDHDHILISSSSIGSNP